MNFSKAWPPWRKRNPSASHLGKDGSSNGLSNADDRYKACSILTQNGIANVIWLEDLLGLYGSNTVVWDLNLLVEDVREASDVLALAGFEETDHDRKFEFAPEIFERGVRLVSTSSPEPSGNGIVLLPAQEWYYDLNEAVPESLPPLHSFLDLTIEMWLSVRVVESLGRSRFGLYLGCLIYYCYSLTDSNGEAVNTADYAKNLKLEHRELHYDIIGDRDGGKQSFTTDDRHQYHVRRSMEIKEGTFIPQPYQKGIYRAHLAPLTEGSEQ